MSPSGWDIATNPPSNSYGATAGLIVGPTQVNLQLTGGADMSGVVAADAAWVTAAAALPNGKGILGIPPGTVKITAPIAQASYNIEGAGIDQSTINVSGSLGAGVSALTLSPDTSGGNATPNQSARGFTLKGQAAYALGGVLGTYGTGITVLEKLLLDEIRITNFDYGVNLNDPTGHVLLRHISMSNSYYGLYITADGGNLSMEDCGSSGHAWAGIGAAFNKALSYATILRSHFGFSPYGIYHEANAAGGNFMNDCLLLNVSFESIGNVAIFDENFAQAGATFNGNTFFKPGHSFNNTFKIAARAQDYAVKIGTTQYLNYFDQGSGGFTAGSSGWLSVTTCQGAIVSVGDLNGAVSIGSHPEFFTKLPRQSGEWQVGSGADVSSARALAIGGTNATFANLGKSNPGTAATTGFPAVPASAGAPTGVPTPTGGFVPIYYDTTNHKIWFYDAGWKGVVVA